MNHRWALENRHGAAPVKLVIAVIQPAKLKAVCEALEKIEVTRMTVCDAQAYGFSVERPELDEAEGPRTVLRRTIVLEVVVNDDFLPRTVEALSHAARTGPDGTRGDGKIFVVPTEEAIQISDGNRGPGAV